MTSASAPSAGSPAAVDRFTLYHARYSRSTRVLWMLTELGLKPDIIELALHPDALRSEAYLRQNRLGRVPTFLVNDRVMHESGAIVEYLAGRFADRGYAVDPTSDDYPDYLNWLHFGEATLQKDVSLIARNVFALPLEQRSAAAVEMGWTAFCFNVEPVEARLAERRYLAGDRFTAADVMVGYTFFLLQLVETQFDRGDLAISERFTRTAAYRDRLLARPAVQYVWGERQRG